MIDPTLVNNLFDATVLDRDDAKVGAVKQVYLDHDSGAPRFVTVRTGLFGMSETFVPLEGASFDGSRLRVPYDEATIKDAPRIDADGELGDDEQERIQRYYEGDDEPEPRPLADEERRDPDRREPDRRDDQAPSLARDGRDRDDEDRGERVPPVPVHHAGHPKHADPTRTPVEERGVPAEADGTRGRVRLRRYIVIEQQETIAPPEPRDGSGADDREREADRSGDGLPGPDRSAADAGGERRRGNGVGPA